MRAFTRETAVAAPLPGINIDTDQIIPARFMRRDRAEGYGAFLVHDHRFDPTGMPDPAFVLNQPAFSGAGMLVAGRNFGCGSSRESAVYALMDFGIRAVLAPSFGDIFYGNALKNGLIPVRLDESVIEPLRDALAAGPEREITVDLEAQMVTVPGGSHHAFAVDAFRRECILKGLDEIGLTLGYREQIEAFEQRHWREHPWVQLPR
jgi:3-isopropylmalate/(R)-2-methylmalate dehydratase small subunit